jgi:hypothetical protein
MEMRWLAVASAMGILWLQGCLVISGGHHSGRLDAPEHYGADPQDPTVVEIGAVRKLSMDSNRQDAYGHIAAREGLSEGAQVYLVASAFRHLSFENAKMSVLMTLIANPSFSPDAKKAILERLDRLAFESNRTAILDAVSKK